VSGLAAGLAAPAAGGREASPIGLVIILILLVAVVFLIRSMNRHLRKVPPTFVDRDERGRPLPPEEPPQP
jgi:hypothetical protein